MTLEEIQSMWKVDSVIDQIDLDKASLNTPSLHAKYLEILKDLSLILLQNMHQRIKIIINLLKNLETIGTSLIKFLMNS